MERLYSELQKHGYNKFVQKTKQAVFVYVPKSERSIAIADISEKLGGRINKSPELMRKFSSLGAITFDKGPFEGLVVGVKPDMAGGLKTDEQETLAGIFIATKLVKPNTDFSLEDLKKYGDANTVSAYKIDKMYEKAGKGWIQSSTTIAETLYKIYKGNKYQIHQRSGSRFEANISNAAKNLIKKSGHVMGLDKWNPADIWMVKPGFEKTNFNKFQTIQELNAWVEEQFNAKTVVGVSLKQVGKTAKTEVFNSGKAPEIHYNGFDVGKTGFEKAINATVFFNGGSFVLRSFGRPVSINAEINGALAQGGKVGSGPLFNIIKRYYPRFNTPTHQQIARDYKANPIKVVTTIYDYMKKLDPSSARKFKDVYQFADFIKKKPNELIYVISKLQSSEAIAAVNSMSKSVRDTFVSAIIAYASSSTEISSMFIRVS